MVAQSMLDAKEINLQVSLNPDCLLLMVLSSP